MQIFKHLRRWHNAQRCGDGRCWRVGFSRWREAIRRREHVTEAPAFAEAAFAEAALRVEDTGWSGAGPAARSRRPNAASLDDSPPALPAGSAPRPQPCFLTVTDHSEDPVPLRQMPNSRAGRGRCKWAWSTMASDERVTSE